MCIVLNNFHIICQAKSLLATQLVFVKVQIWLMKRCWVQKRLRKFGKDPEDTQTKIRLKSNEIKMVFTTI